MSIYEQLKAAGVPLDHHESDLYAKVTPDSQRIVQAYEWRSNVSTFVSNGERWYDIPFAAHVCSRLWSSAVTGFRSACGSSGRSMPINDAVKANYRIEGEE